MCSSTNNESPPVFNILCIYENVQNAGFKLKVPLLWIIQKYTDIFCTVVDYSMCHLWAGDDWSIY